MMSNQSVVNRCFDEICNGRKLGVADEIFAAKHRYHDPSSPWVGTGPDGIKQLVSVYQTAFPDAHWQVDEMLTSGDRVIARWTGTGTHRGDLAGLGPTGKSVSVAGVWIFRVEKGLIAESWNLWDTLGMMQQVGAVPAFGRAGAA